MCELSCIRATKNDPTGGCVYDQISIPRKWEFQFNQSVLATETIPHFVTVIQSILGYVPFLSIFF